MKKTSTMIRTGLVALLLSTTASVFGQVTGTGTISKPPLGVGPVETAYDDPTRATILDAAVTGTFSTTYEEANTVLFYNPTTNGPSMTLVASLTEDHSERTGSEALAFTMYKWYYMGQDGGTASEEYGLVAAGTEKEVGVDADPNKHSVTELSPGFHYFRVQGFIIPPDVDESEVCPPDAEEVFVVFVLPPLTVTTTNTAGELLQYCESDAETQGNVAFSTAVVYDEDYYSGNPPVGEFDFNYRWYYVKSTGTDPFSQDHGDFVEVTKADITNATLVEDEDEATYTPAIDEIGTYKFFVEVEYQIKDRSTGLSADVPNDRNRPYVIYRGWFGGTDQETASIVTITPAPGKPHITIEEVID